MESEVVASAWPKLGNEAIAKAIQANIEAVGLPEWSEEEVAFAKKFQKALGIEEVGLSTEVGTLAETKQGTSSNDNGDVTWVVPSGLLSFPSAVPGVRAHNWQAGVGPTMSFAHKGEVAGAKVLAASMLDLLTDASLRENAHAEFQKVTAKSEYFSLLPEDAEPSIDMNKELMAEFRPQMEEFYLEDVHPRFE
jgi:aminobenzoyl-glutamate utilization protein B